MPKNVDWKGVGDARPCSSSESQSSSYTPSRDRNTEDWKGKEDARPQSGTKSQSVNVGNAKD